MGEGGRRDGKAEKPGGRAGPRSSWVSYGYIACESSLLKRAAESIIQRRAAYEVSVIPRLSFEVVLCITSVLVLDGDVLCERMRQGDEWIPRQHLRLDEYGLRGIASCSVHGTTGGGNPWPSHLLYCKLTDPVAFVYPLRMPSEIFSSCCLSRLWPKRWRLRGGGEEE